MILSHSLPNTGTLLIRWVKFYMYRRHVRFRLTNYTQRHPHKFAITNCFDIYY